MLRRGLHSIFAGNSTTESDEYELLEEYRSTRTHRSRFLIFSSRKLRKLIYVGFVFCAVAGITKLSSDVLPPNYDEIRDFERRQAGLSDHSPGVNRYLHISGQRFGHGFNNVLQETLLLSYLANLANRSYVFQDYVWSTGPLSWSIDTSGLRPSRIPLNAFIAGPAAGDPSHKPTSVTEDFWEIACPRAERVIVVGTDNPIDADTDVIIRYWLDKLSQVDEECVEIDATRFPVFSEYMYGENRILSISDAYTSSPTLQNFQWSPLVQSALLPNFALFGTSASVFTNSSSKITLPGLATIHIRRGDYDRHCHRLAEWGARYMGFNQDPRLPDRFTEPTSITDLEERKGHYIRHCLPSKGEIVRKLHHIREANPQLQRVYILTNAWWTFIDELKDALIWDGWTEVLSSLDLVLDPQQKYVSVAVDMAIAQKSEVFVGNGFSSLTANVVMMRLVKGLDPSSNRFL